LTVPAAAALALVTTYLTPLLVSIAPEWLLHGIGIAGTGAAGCLGIALAMRANARGWRLVAFMIGFLLTVFLGVPFAPLLAIGMAGVGIYFLIRHVARREVSLPLHAQRTFWLWQFFSHSSYSFSRLQGSGFACALAPALQRLNSASARAAALQRNLTFFNVEPNWGSLVVGVTLKQEEAHARGEIAVEEITSTRQQLMGSISGFGDRVSQADLLPLILSLGLAISLGNSMISPLAGVLVYLALICPLMLSISYFAFRAGYLHGRNAILSTLGSTILQRWVSIAQTAGVLMLGVLAALPSITGALPATSDNWFSPALSLILILVLYLLVHGTRLKPTWVLLLLLFVSAGLSAAGIL
jgi:mannose/fructose/N-acetylgalactosamine-specific phosphotransferase system component IID